MFLRAEGNRLCVKMANDLVSRTGRLRQRYDNQCRLVAGCIPYRYKEPAEACSGTAKQELEVLMIFSRSGKALLFPKGGWENDESVQEAACREAFEEAGVRGIIKEDLGSWEDDRGLEGFHRTHMFALLVTEELDSWPEQDERQRKWVTITEADAGCKHDWMRQALHSCVTYLSSIQEAICAHPVRPLQTYRRRSQDSSHGTNRQDTSQAWLWVTASSQTYLRPDLPALPDPLTNHLIGVSSLWSQMLER